MSLRSRCGSERKPPEPSKQRWPGPTPQVGQVTEDNCSGVKSRILIPQSCEIQIRKTVRFETELRFSLRTSDFDSWQLVQDLGVLGSFVLWPCEEALNIEPIMEAGSPGANRKVILARAETVATCLSEEVPAEEGSVGKKQAPHPQSAMVGHLKRQTKKKERGRPQGRRYVPM